MALTPHATLRQRLLVVLEAHGGSAKRATLLEALQAKYRDQWTTEDQLPQNTRQFESKWRNRTSFERQRMIEAGLLEARRDGVWALTDRGRDSIRTFDRGKAKWRDHEIARRERIWETIAASATAEHVEPQLLHRVGLYAGARGIYVDVDRTRSEYSPAGAALSFLHLGERYDNELSDGGVVYHFPKSRRPGRDEAEINATQAAFSLGLPIFVIMLATDSARHRRVVRSFVEDINTANGTALLTFIHDDELPPAPLPQAEMPFDLVDLDSAERWSRRRSRPHQLRFAFDVLSRYGGGCAVCDLRVPAVIEAAHLRPKSRSGSDDARNGIPLCSNHHRMFDAFLWAVKPDDLSIRIHEAYTAESLGITRPNLKHLLTRPHEDALRDAWTSWKSRSKGIK